jgi:hypothetical protein
MLNPIQPQPLRYDHQMPFPPVHGLSSDRIHKKSNE